MPIFIMQHCKHFIGLLLDLVSRVAESIGHHSLPDNILNTAPKTFCIPNTDLVSWVV
jgi:hypothetical protein